MLVGSAHHLPKGAEKSGFLRALEARDVARVEVERAEALVETRDVERVRDEADDDLARDEGARRLPAEAPVFVFFGMMTSEWFGRASLQAPVPAAAS